MKDYYFKNDCFVIENYQSEPPFQVFCRNSRPVRNFIWAFYVNHDQGIACFGIRDKNGAIMEYHPADNSYLWSTDRLRTFIRTEGRVRIFR